MRRLLSLGISAAVAALAVVYIVASGAATSTSSASATQGTPGEIQLTVGFNLVTYAGPTLPVEEALVVALGDDLDAAGAVFSFDPTTQQWDTWGAGAPSFVNTLVALETDRPYFVRATRTALWGGPRSDPSPSPFVGAWHTIDADGSNIWVFISHEVDDLFLVRWYEDGGSICDPETLPPVLLEFVAQETGNMLSGDTGRAWCQFDGWTEVAGPGVTVSFEYDDQAGTIVGRIPGWQRSDATWPAVALSAR